MRAWAGHAFLYWLRPYDKRAGARGILIEDRINEQKPKAPYPVIWEAVSGHCFGRLKAYVSDPSATYEATSEQPLWLNAGDVNAPCEGSVFFT